MKLLQRIFKNNKNPGDSPSKSENDAPGYYLLECWNQYADLPESLLPYVDAIKTKEEWEKLGFVLDTNKYGQIRKLKVANKYFSFIKVDGKQPAEKIAISKGKRYTQNPEYIALLIERGCDPDEFQVSIHNK